MSASLADSAPRAASLANNRRPASWQPAAESGWQLDIRCSGIRTDSGKNTDVVSLPINLAKR